MGTCVLESARGNSSSVDVDASCVMVELGVGESWRKSCSAWYQDNLSTIFLRMRFRKFCISREEAVEGR